jgi:broad specificity phosphatase PhoE
MGNGRGKPPKAVNRDFHDAYVRWLADPGWRSPTGGERGIDVVFELIVLKYQGDW